MIGRVLLLCSLLIASAGIFADDLFQQARGYYASGKYQSAVIQLKNALQQSPNDAEARLLLGQIYLELGNTRAAEKELNRAKSLGVAAAEIMPLLGQAYLQQGQLSKVLEDIALDEGAPVAARARVAALKGDAQFASRALDDAQMAYQEALKIDPQSAEAMLGLARLALVNKNLSEAEARVDKLVSQFPGNADVWIIRARLLQQQSELSAARDAFKKAVEIKPHHYMAVVGKATVEIALKHYDAAMVDVEFVLKASPGNPVANYLKALILFNNHEYTSAKEVLNLVLKQAPNHLQGQLLLGLIHYADNELEQAEYYLRRFVAVAPGHVPGRKALAAVYMKLNQAQKAIETLDVVAQPDKDAQFLALLGSAYVQAGKYVEGTMYLQRAVALAPDVASIRAQLALGKMVAGEDDTAVSELEMAVELDSELIKADMLLIYAHMRKNDFDQAIATAKALVDKKPKEPVALNLLGASYEGKGEFNAAQSQYENALKIDADFSMAYMGLARLAYRRNDTDAAKGYYQRLLQKNNKHLAAMLAMAQLAEVEGDHQASLTWIEKASASNPKAVQPALLLVNAYLSNGNALKALAVAREAEGNMATPPPQLLEALGRAQAANKDFNSAMATFRKLVTAEPDSLRAHLLLAETQIMAKQLQDAAKTLRLALKLKGDLVPVQVSLARVSLELGELEQAAKISKELQKTHSDLGVGFELEGDVAMSSKELTRAAELYGTAFSKIKTPKLALKLHSVKKSLGHNNNIEPLEEYLKTAPADWNVRQAAAMAYQKIGASKKAIDAYKLVLSIQPNSVVSLNNLAWLLQETGDKQSVEYAERAYNLAADNPAVVDTVGWILVQNGQLDRGLVMLQDAKIRAPHMADISYHLAVALDKASRKIEARKVLERLLRDHSDFENKMAASELLGRLQSE